MLDFYLIDDNQPKPDYPEQANLVFVNGINYTTYESLIEKEIIDSRFDYYSDFRWNKQLIEQLRNRIIKVEHSDIKILQKILNKATESKTGLIAYCD